MQKIVEALRKKGKIFKKILEVSPKELGIRNRIKIYRTVDTNGVNGTIFCIEQKSKVLKKDFLKYEEIFDKLSFYLGIELKSKLIFIDAPLCSKAEVLLRESGWRIV